MGGNCMVEKYLWNVKVLRYYTQINNRQISMIWLSKFILQASWMKKSKLILYKYNCDVLSLMSQDFRML
jgi:hypothetical protein